MTTLLHTLRRLKNSPGFTFVSLLTLALGIGVNTSMFTVLNALLFHTPPYPEPSKLVRVFRTGPTFETGPHSPANFLDLQAQAHSFSALAAFSEEEYSLVETGRPADRLRGLDVTGDFFHALGVSPALGRFITPADDVPGHDGVVVLSNSTWQGRFGGDPSIVGRQLQLSGDVVTVIGVMPAGFEDPLVWGQIDAWRPAAYDAKTRAARGANWLRVIGRLRDGTTEAQALAEISTIGANLARTYPDTNAKSGYNVASLARATQNKTGRLVSWFAMGLAACVLLIACANLANLVFARNARRAREHAIRASLGATRYQIIRLSLYESVLLGLGGGLLGLLLAVWLNDALGARLAVAGQLGFALPLAWRVILFAATVGLLVGVGFGLLPALLGSRAGVHDQLKQGGRGTTGAYRRTSNALIITEVALALVLLSGAGFFLRGLERFVARDYGWRAENLLTANLVLPPAHYSDDASQLAFYDRALPRLAALPGVERVALSRTLPFAEFGWGQRFLVEGRPPPAPGAEPQRDVNGVSPGYFDTIGLALVAGRDFTADDLHGPMRTIISESMARQLWPGENAVGKRIMHPVEKEWQEIIGVVRNVTFAANLDRATSPFQTYRLLAREPGRSVVVSLRSSLAPASLAESVRRVMAEIDPELPVQDIQLATQVVEQRLSNYTLIGSLLAGFALLGVLLAAVGIYAVIAGSVAQRTSEIGIRMALGAQVRDVLRLVLGQGLRLTLIGIGLGIGGSFATARLLSAIMPALPAPELLTALAVSFALIAVAILACWLPARRAARVDPLTALRTE